MNEPERPSPLDPRRAPHFMVAGQAKTGSTALAEYLRRHPGVFMTEPKEPNYFRTDDVAQRYHDLERRRPFRPRDQARTVEWYEGLFAGAQPGQMRGEASVGYLRGGRACAQRIRAAVPDVRLIFILRQPADRAYSAYLHQRKQGRETLSFRAALAIESRRMAVPWTDMFAYRGNMAVFERLQGFYEVFGAAAIKVMLYDDWSDRAAFVREVLTFIGVATEAPLDLTQRFNAGAVPRVSWLQRRLAPETSQRLRRLVPAAWWRQLKVWVDRSRARNLVAAPPLDPALRRHLTAECRADILKTQELIGRDLSRWMA